MAHVLLDIDEDVDPITTELVVRVVPDDDTVFEVCEGARGSLVGLGYRVRLGAPSLFACGVGPTLLHRVAPEDQEPAPL